MIDVILFLSVDTADVRFENFHNKTDVLQFLSQLTQIKYSGNVALFEPKSLAQNEPFYPAGRLDICNNMPIEVVSKALGHSSINMTQRYARITEALISKNMSKITDF